MSQDHPATNTRAFAIPSKRLLLLVGVLLLTAAAAYQWYGAKFGGWSHERDVTGVIVSVASGNMPDGREIVVLGGMVQKSYGNYTSLVCCHDAGSGKILWEQQSESIYFSDLEDLQIWVAVDARGDVLTASRISGMKMARVEKRTGAEGRLLWSKHFTYPGNFQQSGYSLLYSHLLPPFVRSDGNLWFLTSSPSGHAQVSLVNGQSGEVMASAPVEENQMMNLQFMDLICLDDGGAILVYARDRNHQRHVSCYSAEGMRIGGFPVAALSAHNGRQEDFRIFVDERNQRLFVCDEMRSSRWGSQSWDSRTVYLTAHSLATGGELWNATLEIEGHWGHATGRIPELFHLRPDGNVEVRHEFRESRQKMDWLNWTMRKGLPMPKRKTETKTRLLTTVVSGSGGSHGTPLAMPRSTESWFYPQAREAGSSTQEERYSLRHSMHVGYVIRCRDSRRWLPVVTDPHGAQDMRCFRMIRTRSGRVVCTRDPRDFSRGKVKLWQVRSNE